jgi:hypothetical protein
MNTALDHFIPSLVDHRFLRSLKFQVRITGTITADEHQETDAGLSSITRPSIVLPLYSIPDRRRPLHQDLRQLCPSCWEG